MHVSRGVLAIFVFLIIVALVETTMVGSAGTFARDVHKGLRGREIPDMERVLVVDGSNVHDVGELRMHVGNWGLFGSWPSGSMPFSHAPSAEWPAGSGVEYLYAAGLWIGAVVQGVPAVSTSQYQMEFYPTEDPIDIVYRSSEGAAGGKRLPDPMADDDGDGAIDEDWLNGRDDDGDGLVDEDFAAISDQMFSCWYTDDQPIASAIHPEHNPLNLLVRQESYQWRSDSFNDFVAVHVTITNAGLQHLEDVYVGVFADMDAGPRDTPKYWEDDAVDYLALPTVCTDAGPAEIQVALGYDVDGDGGRTPGYFGVLLLDCTTDPTGEKAPRESRVCTYANFFGEQPFEEGGLPTNDFERYELLSSRTIERGAVAPRDYSTLMAVGPFPLLDPGETIAFRIAFVIGEGIDGMIENAAAARRFYDGAWFDIDRDPLTGVDRRETPVHGPATDVVIDPCRPELSRPIPLVPEGTTVWVNSDCEREGRFKADCGYAEADSSIFRTGVAGRERQVNWHLGGALVRTWLDVQPGTCPNRLIVNPGGRGSGKNDESMAGGALRVALLGRADFDVTRVDIESLRLEGASPVRGAVYRDVGTEPMRERACVCPGEKPDGRLDLVLKFREREVIAALEPVSDGEERVVTMTGRMTDGRVFEAVDCVVMDVVGGSGRPEKTGSAATRAGLRFITPNPLNPVTRIGYFLPDEGYATLSVYDVAGRLVERLVAGVEPAGDHVVEWDASGASSGIYFCRLETGGAVETRKLIVMK